MLSDNTDIEFIDGTAPLPLKGPGQPSQSVCSNSLGSSLSPDRPLLTYCDRLINSFFPTSAGEHPPTVESFQYGAMGSKQTASVNMFFDKFITVSVLTDKSAGHGFGLS
jgi:hypothetical protein